MGNRTEPHTNTRFFQGEGDDSFWLEGTLELLRRCDAVMMVDGWQASEGAYGEWQEANRLGIPIFQDLAELKEWVNSNAPQTGLR